MCTHNLENFYQFNYLNLSRSKSVRHSKTAVAKEKIPLLGRNSSLIFVYFSNLWIYFSGKLRNTPTGNSVR